MSEVDFEAGDGLGSPAAALPPASGPSTMPKNSKRNEYERDRREKRKFEQLQHLASLEEEADKWFLEYWSGRKRGLLIKPAVDMLAGAGYCLYENVVPQETLSAILQAAGTGGHIITQCQVSSRSGFAFVLTNRSSVSYETMCSGWYRKGH